MITRGRDRGVGSDEKGLEIGLEIVVASWDMGNSNDKGVRLGMRGRGGAVIGSRSRDKESDSDKE